MIVNDLCSLITGASEFISNLLGAIPNTAVGGVVVSFASAMVVYAARQSWERRKLRRALLTEVEQMEGLGDCSDQMDRIDPPPGRQIKPDDVPASGTIPTVVYESNAGNIGLLRGYFAKDELEPVVRFYSKVLRYKSIINEIRSEGETSDAGQEDLYESIGDIAEQQKEIIEQSEFK